MQSTLAGFLLVFQLLQAVTSNMASPSLFDQQMLSGRLDGDADLEGGCVWLEVVGGGEETSSYQPLWPRGYSVAFNPVRLKDQEGRVVAEEGDVLTVQGRERRDVITTCMRGTPYQVERILAVNGRPVPPG